MLVADPIPCRRECKAVCIVCHSLADVLLRARVESTDLQSIMNVSACLARAHTHTHGKRVGSRESGSGEGKHTSSVGKPKPMDIVACIR